MVELILFLFAGIGLTSIIVDSEFFSQRKQKYQDRTKEIEEKDGAENKIVQRRKKIFYMLNCYQCSGFWVGILLSLFLHPFNMSWYLLPLECLIGGGVISYTAQVGMALFNYLNVSYGSQS
jgi:hypothetical protein